ncbi:MAG: hypothetical protein H6999_05385 [Hahellaceae bacterium]|nr:hypothetical protein [Hahellaceae bacterium]MCP5169171.1 hypothetical protein [Hahellaceae bacterium]
MKHKLRILALAVVTVNSAMLSLPAQAEVVVIVNKAVTASASREELRRIFLGKSNNLEDGTRLIPIYLPDGNAEREELGIKLLKKTPSQLEVHWSKLQFTGKGERPSTVSDAQAMVNYISKHREAIGYISPSALTNDVREIARF